MASKYIVDEHITAELTAYWFTVKCNILMKGQIFKLITSIDYSG